jgi:hypothetical protein
MAEEPKVKKARKPSKTRIAKALEAFTETLPAFCETTLSNGSRSGKEWQVPDLQNNPRENGKPGSCSINLETGAFFDFNPTAVPQRGGPIDLFGAIFGLSDFGEIIVGIENWVKDGTLPDGSKGVPVAGKIEISPGEVLEARDDEEKEWIHAIRKNQNWRKWRKEHPIPPVRTKIGANGEKSIQFLT